MQRLCKFVLPKNLRQSLNRTLSFFSLFLSFFHRQEILLLRKSRQNFLKQRILTSFPFPSWMRSTVYSLSKTQTVQAGHPNIQQQILIDFVTFPWGISCENLITVKSIVPLTIILTNCLEEIYIHSCVVRLIESQRKWLQSGVSVLGRCQFRERLLAAHLLLVRKDSC